jgi:alpha-tubulin suppressor-like RCC1 family protein
MQKNARHIIQQKSIRNQSSLTSFHVFPYFKLRIAFASVCEDLMNRNERANTVFEAAKLNDYIFLSRLLSEGNDANERNEWGLTCLHICATCGSLECAKVLVAFGANLEVRDMESGWTALHRAFFFNQISMALFLMASGASLDSCEIVDHEGLTPLSLLSLLLKDSLEKSGNQSGVVVSFGKADYTLGIPLPKASEVLRPKVVESLLQDSIVDVQATKYHSYAITSAGLVYSWGHGKGGRLGHGDDKSRFEPTVISGLISIKIRKISASDSHALALTENGEIFSWGSNSLGQLGQGSGENSRLLSSPKRIESLRGVAVVGISAGENHSLCHTSSSELYGWGNNERGQLGVSITTGTNTVFIPKRISQASSSLLKQSSAKITQVLASSSCSMLLITSRQHGSDVLFWGNNSHFFRRVHFRRNVHPSDCSIVQLAAGNDIFFGISESGLVYSWHDENSSTIYSQSAKQEEINCTPRIIESLHPKNGGQKVVFISASHGRVCATSETGDLYSWSYAVSCL